MSRRVPVTGAAGGIGRAIVARAVAQGWRVALLDLPSNVSALAGVMPEASAPSVLRIACDLRRDDDVASAVQSVSTAAPYAVACRTLTTTGRC